MKRRIEPLGSVHEYRTKFSLAKRRDDGSAAGEGQSRSGRDTRLAGEKKKSATQHTWIGKSIVDWVVDWLIIGPIT